jgi:hypothetical protein
MAQAYVAFFRSCDSPNFWLADAEFVLGSVRLSLATAVVQRGRGRPPTSASCRADAGEEVIHAPAGAIRVNGRSTPAIEVIRFAGANRLCVDLDYVDEHGRRSARTIEPYSLRRTQAGAIVLYAVRADAQQHRSYRIDRIQGASVTSQTFVPRYAIELTPAGPLVAPMTDSRAGPAMPVVRRIRSSAYAPVHVFRCPVCNKRFERKTYDVMLRPHKAPQGWTCSGQHGIYEGRK